MSASLINVVEQLVIESAQYVFQEMFNITLARDTEAPLATEPDGQIVSSVGYVGEVNGVIHLYAGMTFAREIAARMLGDPATDLASDDIVNEAMSELGNVMVGQVKSHLCDAGHACAITVPSVLRGQQLTIGEISDTSYRLLGFRDGDHRLLVELAVKEDRPA